MMKLPSKLYSYTESTISKFPIVLNAISSSDVTVYDLYQKLNNQFLDISDFASTLTCLYALNKIDIVEDYIKIIK